MKNEKGLPGYFKPVEVKVPNDVFENSVRAYGVVSACEWFGHSSDSLFVQDTIEHFEYFEYLSKGK